MRAKEHQRQAELSREPRELKKRAESGQAQDPARLSGAICRPEACTAAHIEKHHGGEEPASRGDRL
ncbi:MAG: hypothetical protein M5U25_20080 [Planctomycetota bacterium]|nr:hypothetical protein [Planctomycetota bacterium]